MRKLALGGALFASLLALNLLGIPMQGAIADDREARPDKSGPLVALHVDKWTPSFSDFLLMAAAGGIAIADSGILNPEFSPKVTTYSATVTDGPGVVVIAVGVSGTKITLTGTAGDGAALGEKLRINQNAGSIKGGDVVIEGAAIKGTGFLGLRPGKNVITVGVDPAGDTPTRTYVTELSR